MSSSEQQQMQAKRGKFASFVGAATGRKQRQQEQQHQQLANDCELASIEWRLDMRRKCCRFFNSTAASQSESESQKERQQRRESAARRCQTAYKQRAQLANNTRRHVISIDCLMPKEEQQQQDAFAENDRQDLRVSSMIGMRGRANEGEEEEREEEDDDEDSLSLGLNECQSDNLSALSASSSLLSQLLNSSLNQLIEIDNGSSASSQPEGIEEPRKVEEGDLLCERSMGSIKRPPATRLFGRTRPEQQQLQSGWPPISAATHSTGAAGGQMRNNQRFLSGAAQEDATSGTVTAKHCLFRCPSLSPTRPFKDKPIMHCLDEEDDAADAELLAALNGGLPGQTLATANKRRPLAASRQFVTFDNPSKLISLSGVAGGLTTSHLASSAIATSELRASNASSGLVEQQTFPSKRSQTSSGQIGGCYPATPKAQMECCDDQESANCCPQTPLPQPCQCPAQEPTSLINANNTTNNNNQRAQQQQQQEHDSLLEVSQLIRQELQECCDFQFCPMCLQFDDTSSASLILEQVEAELAPAVHQQAANECQLVATPAARNQQRPQQQRHQLRQQASTCAESSFSSSSASSSTSCLSSCGVRVTTTDSSEDSGSLDQLKQKPAAILSIGQLLAKPTGDSDIHYNHYHKLHASTGATGMGLAPSSALVTRELQVANSESSQDHQHLHNNNNDHHQHSKVFLKKPPARSEQQQQLNYNSNNHSHQSQQPADSSLDLDWLLNGAYADIKSQLAKWPISGLLPANSGRQQQPDSNNNFLVLPLLTNLSIERQAERQVNEQTAIFSLDPRALTSRHQQQRPDQVQEDQLSMVEVTANFARVVSRDSSRASSRPSSSASSLSRPRLGALTPRGRREEPIYDVPSSSLIDNGAGYQSGPAASQQRQQAARSARCLTPDQKYPALLLAAGGRRIDTIEERQSESSRGEHQESMAQQSRTTTSLVKPANVGGEESDERRILKQPEEVLLGGGKLRRFSCHQELAGGKLYATSSLLPAHHAAGGQCKCPDCSHLRGAEQEQRRTRAKRHRRDRSESAVAACLSQLSLLALHGSDLRATKPKSYKHPHHNHRRHHREPSSISDMGSCSSCSFGTNTGYYCCCSSCCSSAIVYLRRTRRRERDLIKGIIKSDGSSGCCCSCCSSSATMLYDSALSSSDSISISPSNSREASEPGSLTEEYLRRHRAGSKRRRRRRPYYRMHGRRRDHSHGRHARTGTVISAAGRSHVSAGSIASWLVRRQRRKRRLRGRKSSRLGQCNKRGEYQVLQQVEAEKRRTDKRQDEFLARKRLIRAKHAKLASEYRTGEAQKYASKHTDTVPLVLKSTRLLRSNSLCSSISRTASPSTKSSSSLTATTKNDASHHQTNATENRYDRLEEENSEDANDDDGQREVCSQVDAVAQHLSAAMHLHLRVNGNYQAADEDADLDLATQARAGGNNSNHHHHRLDNTTTATAGQLKRRRNNYLASGLQQAQAGDERRIIAGHGFRRRQVRVVAERKSRHRRSSSSNNNDNYMGKKLNSDSATPRLTAFAASPTGEERVICHRPTNVRRKGCHNNDSAARLHGDGESAAQRQVRRRRIRRASVGQSCSSSLEASCSCHAASRSRRHEGRRSRHNRHHRHHSCHCGSARRRLMAANARRGRYFGVNGAAVAHDCDADDDDKRRARQRDSHRFRADQQQQQDGQQRLSSYRHQRKAILRDLPGGKLGESELLKRQVKQLDSLLNPRRSTANFVMPNCAQHLAEAAGELGQSRLPPNRMQFGLSRRQQRQRASTAKDRGYPLSFAVRRQRLNGSTCTSSLRTSRCSYRGRHFSSYATMNQLRSMQKALAASEAKRRSDRHRRSYPHHQQQQDQLHKRSQQTGHTNYGINRPAVTGQFISDPNQQQFMNKFLVKTFTPTQEEIATTQTGSNLFNWQLARRCHCSHCCLVDKFIFMDAEAKRKRKLARKLQQQVSPLERIIN